MSADLLREAASKMRERAEAATDGGPRWETGPDDMHGPARAVVYPADSDSAVAFAGCEDAEHIASWHPAVALAVADWLDRVAETSDVVGAEPSPDMTAVARAYLGDES